MAIREYYKEPTPSGAAAWDIIFFDDKNNPIDESNATWYKLHEYNESGSPIRGYMGLCIKSS